MLRTVALISFLSLSSCVALPPPYEEYVLARAAVQAAQDTDSPRFATGLWNLADENYRLGQRAFRDSDYGPAKVYFKKATEFAERAENVTRLKKFQTGDSFP